MKRKESINIRAQNTLTGDGRSGKPKTLNVCCVNQAKKVIPDLEVYGNGDSFRLICKASSQKEGWMKSTKALEIKDAGCLVQVSTQQRNPDGSYALAEALTFVPNVTIVNTIEPNQKPVLVKKALQDFMEKIPSSCNSADGFPNTKES